MTATPLQLVSMLYRGAIEAIEDARECLRTGDIAGRAKPVNKAFSVFLELIGSLDHERGAEVGARLEELYCYMQQRLLEAHAMQSDEKFVEVLNLLRTLLDAWEQVGRQTASSSGEVAYAASAASGSTFAEGGYSF
jgi:flagellar secretion chaperone FliS